MLINLNQISYSLRFKKYPYFIKKFIYNLLIKLNRGSIDEEILGDILRINKVNNIATYACCSGHSKSDKNKHYHIGYIACQFLGNNPQFEHLVAILGLQLFKVSPRKYEHKHAAYTLQGGGIELSVDTEYNTFSMYWYRDNIREHCVSSLEQILNT